MGLFGKSKTPKEHCQEWTKTVRQEQRQVTRQIRDIERVQAKTKTEIKANAKKGNVDACKVLAKEIVQSNRAVSRLHKVNADLTKYFKNSL